jgi:hypothetical protein
MESTSSTVMSVGQEHHRRSAHAGISPQMPSISIKEGCVEGEWVSEVGCWSIYMIYKLVEFTMVGS